jgi:uncharacterized protein YeaO (DUF488 family)
MSRGKCRISTLAPRMGVVRMRVGRVYDARTDQDGMRVLVDRLWPRGLTKAHADLDEWCKDSAPTTALRKWYAHDPERFAEFRRRYRAELATGSQAEALARLRALIGNGRNVTLLTAAKDPAISEAAVLADLLNPKSSRR